MIITVIPNSIPQSITIAVRRTHSWYPYHYAWIVKGYVIMTNSCGLRLGSGSLFGLSKDIRTTSLCWSPISTPRHSLTAPLFPLEIFTGVHSRHSTRNCFSWEDPRHEKILLYLYQDIADRSLMRRVCSWVLVGAQPFCYDELHVKMASGSRTSSIDHTPRPHEGSEERDVYCDLRGMPVARAIKTPPSQSLLQQTWQRYEDISSRHWLHRLRHLPRDPSQDISPMKKWTTLQVFEPHYRLMPNFIPPDHIHHLHPISLQK